MNRPAATLGVLGLALNVVAVGLVAGFTSPYRPGDLDGWAASVRAMPVAATGSAWAFTLGLAALVPFVRALPSLPADRPALADAGGWLVAVGAILNATACPAIAVLATVGGLGDDVARALLGFALVADAAFNALLGAGLLLLAAGLRLPLGLRVVGLVAGVASLPVALQFLDDRFAGLLAVSGPLWLLWCFAMALRLWGRP